jgi:hypothetical protein
VKVPVGATERFVRGLAGIKPFRIGRRDQSQLGIENPQQRIELFWTLKVTGNFKEPGC